MKEILYKSTRSEDGTLKASEAILKGLADDGGLFVPIELPELDKSMKELAGMKYQEVAYEVMKLFFTDFTEEELKKCIDKAYDEKFDTEEIAPLAQVKDPYHLELFHGPTIAEASLPALSLAIILILVVFEATSEIVPFQDAVPINGSSVVDQVVPFVEVL